MTTPPEPPADDDMHTRDLGTLNDAGEDESTGFETPSARGGQHEAESQRPKFSPVAQPGQVEEIHWHTVKSEQRAGEHNPSPGMQHRLDQHGHGHQGGHHHGHHRNRKGGGGKHG